MRRRKHKIMKNHMLTFVLFLVYTVTLINLFYRPYLNHFTLPSRLATLPEITPVSGMDRLLCPVRGFKCDTAHCSCDTICGDQKYEKITVLEGQDIIVVDEKLTPGTYCVPKGIASCNRESSIGLFSTAGWVCRNKPFWRGDHFVACHSSEAVDNTQNFVIDRLTNAPIQWKDVRDFYESLPDGDLRYKCVCNSLDTRGNRMVNILPFTCSVDYCIQDFIHSHAVMGWKGTRCECGVYPQADPRDPTSPCVYERTRIENDVFIGRVPCMTAQSITPKPIYCPEQVAALGITKRIHLTDDPLEYLRVHADSYVKDPP